MAKIRITTVPDGAEVFTGDGPSLGTTPITLEFPEGATQTLVFRHPDAEERTMKLPISGDTAINVELELRKKHVRAVHKSSHKSSHKTTKKPDKKPDLNGVMGPSFD